MSIQFNQIPASIRKPGTYLEFNTALAVRTLPTNAQRVCLIVPLTSTDPGKADALTPVAVSDAAQAGVLFGAVAQAMVAAAITATVLTGTLDELEHDVGREGHTVRINGRDLAGTLVDCSTPFVSLREASLQQIVDQVVKPLGIATVRLQTDQAATRRRIQVQPGQTAWEALQQVAEANGLWPWMEPDGTLVVGGPDYAAAPVGELRLRADGQANNVQRLAVRRSIAQRFSEVRVLGQHGMFDNRYDAPTTRTAIESKVTDDALARRGIFRPRVVVDSGCDSANLARDRATKLLADSQLAGFEIRARVPGWRATGGAVWTPGQRVQVVSEPHGLDGTYFLMSRTLRLTRRDGAITDLSLREDKRWIVSERVRKQRKGAAAPRIYRVRPAGRDRSQPGHASGQRGAGGRRHPRGMGAPRRCHRGGHAMSFGMLLRGLLPPVSYDPNAPMLGAVLDAEGAELQAARDSAQRVANAMHPDTAGDDIVGWESMLALQPVPSATQPQRAAAVKVKLGELGGLSIPYFTRLAAAAGYTVTITEPRVFRAGVSRCGDRLYPEDIVFLWQVRIDQRPAGANAAMDAALQFTFDDLKPAHTMCQFVEQ